MNKNVLEEIRQMSAASVTQNPETEYRVVEDWMLSADDAEVHDIEGEAVEIPFDAGARAAISAIRWTCRTDRGNRLFYNGNPFRARCVSYSVSGISWQAGAGWPVYTSYCPQPNFSASMRFRDAKRHQVVPVFGGNYWIGCSADASGCGNRTTDVWFWVNDDKYDDNTGTFNLTITSYS